MFNQYAYQLVGIFSAIGLLVILVAHFAFDVSLLLICGGLLALIIVPNLVYWLIYVPLKIRTDNLNTDDNVES